MRRRPLTAVREHERDRARRPEKSGSPEPTGPTLTLGRSIARAGYHWNQAIEKNNNHDADSCGRERGLRFGRRQRCSRRDQNDAAASPICPRCERGTNPGIGFPRLPTHQEMVDQQSTDNETGDGGQVP